MSEKFPIKYSFRLERVLDTFRQIIIAVQEQGQVPLSFGEGLGVRFLASPSERLRPEKIGRLGVRSLFF